MAARQIRRVFATPFIVTLAASSVPACGPKPLPKHDHVNPPGPHTNPPAPDTQPSSTTPPGPEGLPPATDWKATTDPAAPASDTNPVDKHTKPPPPQRPEPVKQSAKLDTKWTVMKVKGQAGCKAYVDVNCPKPEPGKEMATCNPPAPINYACPDGMADGASLKIILRAGATDCFVDRGPMACPPNAKCNPPPPRKVACPER